MSGRAKPDLTAFQLRAENLVSPEDKKKAKEFFRKYLRNPASQREHFQILTKDKNVKHVLVGVDLLTGDDIGEPVSDAIRGTLDGHIWLSRDLANKRIWPAVDLSQSGTRKEELLLSQDAAEKTYRIRRVLSDLPPEAQMTTLLQALGRFETNEQFLQNLPI